MAGQERLTRLQAQRIALAAQGFTGRKPASRVERRHLLRLLDRIGLFQIDSVNVAQRAQYMPAFSRLGAYDTSILDRAQARRPRALFEYWAHEASLLPVEIEPLLRWRMERARQGRGIYSGLATFGRERRTVIDHVLREVERNGPLTAADIDGHRGASGWWEWSEPKRALEWLFWAGLVTTHSRGPNFERLYDLPERVLPPQITARPTPSPADAQRSLMEIAAKAHGVATASDLRDYFRLAPEDARPRIEELVEDGVLVPVAVKGWTKQAYLHRAAQRPRKVEARALLAPFDPLIWERSRTERLFDFHYRIEIYTPAEKRVYGYYVFPFLLGERIVARVDLKADRRASALQVQSAFAERKAPPETAAELFKALTSMAAWLGLERVDIRHQGDLAPQLKATAES
ncbi:MAG: winged helix-turn-helix domain-containing protein [Pseudomonadota bacterium]|uniref:winged helix-turn-helix domain-containing protein n=1 Tax=Fodinicurvata fenggangensis TaxID=1121830 RepID=UPI00047C7AF0|nr:crosslink repair DNA glycosylase YcaQ family protein [Fodinicurvata fenggangensis]